MFADIIYGMLPEHIMLGLILSLMVLEITGTGRRTTGILYLIAVAGGALALIHQLVQGYSAVIAADEFAIDRFTILSKLVLMGACLVHLLCFPGRIDSHKERMLAAASLLGGLIMMGSSGFIPLFIGMEMLSLPAFALMLHGRGSSEASEGAFKYLLLSSVASALILFGTSIAYGVTGSLAIAPFAAALRSGDAPIIAAATLILSGFSIKTALFPFHAWTPDAYSSAQLPVTSLLASVVKGAAVLALAKVFSTGLPPGEMATLVGILSVASICYGNVTAIGQSSFRRLLAYSSVSHAGYMIFSLSDRSGATPGTLLYYVATYAATTIVACACFAILAGRNRDDLQALNGAFHARPLPTLILAFSLFSLAGIPPMPGFLAKLFVFRSVMASGQLLLPLLAFCGSFLGVVYYLRIVFRLFGPATFASAPREENCIQEQWGIAIATMLLLFSVICPDILSDSSIRQQQARLDTAGNVRMSEIRLSSSNQSAPR